MFIIVKGLGTMQKRMKLDEKHLVVIELLIPERKVLGQGLHIFLTFQLVKDTTVGREVCDQSLAVKAGLLPETAVRCLAEDIVAGISFTQDSASVQAVKHIGTYHLILHKAVWKDDIIRIQEITLYISHGDHLRTIVPSHLFEWGAMPGVEIDLSLLFDKTSRERSIIYQITGTA